MPCLNQMVSDHAEHTSFTNNPTDDPTFNKYLNSVKSKGFFKDCEPGTTEHEQRLEKVVQTYMAKMLNRTTKRAEAAASDSARSEKKRSPDSALVTVRPPRPTAQKEADDWKARGNARCKEQNYLAAVECYTKAIEVDPEGANTHSYLSNRATCNCRLGDSESAVEDLEMAISLAPEVGKHYARYGYALVLQSRNRDALNAFRTANTMAPSKSVTKYLEDLERQEQEGTLDAEMNAPQPQPAASDKRSSKWGKKLHTRAMSFMNLDAQNGKEETIEEIEARIRAEAEEQAAEERRLYQLEMEAKLKEVEEKSRQEQEELNKQKALMASMLAGGNVNSPEMKEFIAKFMATQVDGEQSAEVEATAANDSPQDSPEPQNADDLPTPNIVWEEEEVPDKSQQPGYENPFASPRGTQEAAAAPSKYLYTTNGPSSPLPPTSPIKSKGIRAALRASFGKSKKHNRGGSSKKGSSKDNSSVGGSVASLDAPEQAPADTPEEQAQQGQQEGRGKLSGSTSGHRDKKHKRGLSFGNGLWGRGNSAASASSQAEEDQKARELLKKEQAEVMSQLQQLRAEHLEMQKLQASLRAQMEG
ncbi:unnamed protein product [Chrysoparadoxa australica]